MSTYWIEWMEKCITEKQIEYYEYDEFSDIEEIGSGLIGKVYKAKWKQSEKYVVLKSFKDAGNEIINEIKLHWAVDFHDNIIKFYGITKTDSDKKEYLLVVECAEGGTLRNYLKENFPSLNWHDKCRLALQLSSAIEYLHKNGIVHNDLHSNSVLVQKNSIKLADFGLSKRVKHASEISLDTIPYTDPKGFNSTNEQIGKFTLNKKSDIYSVGVLFWELSSGKKPFDGRKYDLFLTTEIIEGLREGRVDGTPEEYSNLYAKCWDGDPDKRPTIQEVIKDLKSVITQHLSPKQQTIQHFKLNHGLFLDGHRIEPSKQAVFSEDGELSMSLYRAQPLVYTSINDHSSHTNLLSFDPGNNNNDHKLNEILQPSDVCIHFPFAEFIYKAGLLESFSKRMDDDETLYERYGHLFAKKVVVGGKLFIDDSVHDSFKSRLTWAYNSAKYNRENPFNNLSGLNFFPKIRTSDGKILNTPGELTNWMNDLFRNNIVDIISYNNLIPISELKLNEFSVGPFLEIQPGVANFKKKLSLEEWTRDSIYDNFIRWTEKFHLLQGQIITEYFKLKISKEVVVDFINIPKIVPSDECYLEMKKQTTNLDRLLISNNISPPKNIGGSFPFIKGSIESCNGYTHFLIKCERYKILLTKDDIKPSEKFKQAIEKALGSMKPSVYLQDLFDEYGHFYPLSIVLGKSLKNILPNSSFSDTSDKINLESPTFESLKPHLDNLNMSILLTQKGDVIEKNGLSNWIQNTNYLEIIESDNIISLHDILEAEQRKKVDFILNAQDNFNIIMTGIVDLKDLDINNTEHYKRIKIETSLDDDNYNVFGSIITKDNLKLKEFSITFELYDLNGFLAIISKLAETNVDIRECYILWMIIGIPSKLSVFSPKNRDLQVNFFIKSITLQPNQLDCHIEIPFSLFPLSQRCAISLNRHSSIFGLKNTIKLIDWSNNSINVKITRSIFNENMSLFPSDGEEIFSDDIFSDSDSDSDNDSNTNRDYKDNNSSIYSIEIAICVLSSGERLKIDSGKGGEYSLDLFGTILTENNFLNVQCGSATVTKLNLAIRASEEFVSYLHRDGLDRGCIATFDDFPMIRQDFTSDKGSLRSLLSTLNSVIALSRNSTLFESISDIIRTFHQNSVTSRSWILVVVTDRDDDLSLMRSKQFSSVVYNNFTKGENNLMFVVGVGNYVNENTMQAIAKDANFGYIHVENFLLLEFALLTIATKVTKVTSDVAIDYALVIGTSRSMYDILRPQCFEGHDLRMMSREYHESKWFCNVCGIDGQSIKLGYHCSSCNFNACYSHCKPGHRCTPAIECQIGHPMRYVDSPDQWRCDGDQKFYKGRHLQCNQCDYDICPKCLTIIALW